MQLMRRSGGVNADSGARAGPALASQPTRYFDQHRR
jgi:hypothetical protein